MIFIQAPFLFSRATMELGPIERTLSRYKSIAGCWVAASSRS